ncbi:MAG: tetraacyldisaccharide 4'-kinase [Deltaproteobacteria bacterium]|nr:tetraacyldisaccharide 4'-kinase [Deltaproteobacteria bacterium]
MNCKKIEEVILSKSGERKNPILCFVLFILSLFYSALSWLKNSLYSSGLLKKKKLPCKVVSIGNLTVGGSGKTPVTIYLAKLLSQIGLKVVVISRGYKRKSKGITIVSNGAEVLTKSIEAGDEPTLIAQRLLKKKDSELLGVPVIVGSNRYKAGLLAIEKFSPDVIVLDDGFQHIKLERDLDILLIDSLRGFGNGHLLPRGPLRENASGSKRASIIMVKGEDPLNFTLPTISEKPIFNFSYKPKSLEDLSGNIASDFGMLTGQSVLALAAIADPAPFFEILNGLGANITSTLTYPNHHWFTTKEVKQIRRESLEVDLLVTTEKDAVRLKTSETGVGLRAYALTIDVVISDEEVFIQTIKSKLDLEN